MNLNSPYVISYRFYDCAVYSYLVHDVYSFWKFNRQINKTTYVKQFKKIHYFTYSKNA